jgi:hypothetical protein
MDIDETDNLHKQFLEGYSVLMIEFREAGWTDRMAIKILEIVMD